MIVRGPRLERDFTILGNAMLRDRKLSWKARGMLAFILSQPPGYKARIEDLVVECEVGQSNRDAMRTGMKELTDAGYVRRERTRQKGRFVWNSVVYDSPQAATDDSSAAGSSTSGNSAHGPTSTFVPTIDELSVDGEPDVNRSTGFSEELTLSQGEREVPFEVEAEANRILGAEVARGKCIANPAAYKAAVVHNLLESARVLVPADPRAAELARARALGHNRAGINEDAQTVVDDLRAAYDDPELAEAAVSAFLDARSPDAGVG